MPSGLHDALVELFRNDPPAVLTLVRDVLGVELPPTDDVAVQDATFLEARTDYHADLVLVLKRGSSVAAVIIVEVQRRRDPDKLFAWPHYAAAARARFRWCLPCSSTGGGEVSDELRARIGRTPDNQLDDLLKRAMVVADVSELFDD